MGRRAFRQLDIARALKAGVAAGVDVSVRIERQTGDLIVLPARLTVSVKEPLPFSDPEGVLDDWLAEHGDG